MTGTCYNHDLVQLQHWLKHQMKHIHHGLLCSAVCLSTKDTIYAIFTSCWHYKAHIHMCFCVIIKWQKVLPVVCVEAWQATSSASLEWRSELSSGYNRHTVAAMCRLTENKTSVANTIQCCLSGLCLTRAKSSCQKSSIMIHRSLRTHLLWVERQQSKHAAQTGGTSLGFIVIT